MCVTALLIQLSLLTAVCASLLQSPLSMPASGPAVLRIAAAASLTDSSRQFIDSSGLLWLPDRAYLRDSAYLGLGMSTLVPLPGLAAPDSALFQHWRAGLASSPLVYDIPLTACAAARQPAALIRMFFAEVEFRAATNRVFSVALSGLAGGRVSIPSLDVFAEAGAASLVVKELYIADASLTTIQLALSQVAGNLGGGPMFQALELFCVQSKLVVANSTAAPTGIATGSTGASLDWNSSALGPSTLPLYDSATGTGMATADWNSSASGTSSSPLPTFGSATGGQSGATATSAPVTNASSNSAAMPVNLDSSSWSRMADLSSVVYEVCSGVVTVNGSAVLIVIGGGSPNTFRLDLAANAYLPDGQRRLVLGDHHACAVVGNQFYVFGGFQYRYLSMKTVQIYDAARDQWVFGSSLPLALGSPSVGVVNAKFYLCGGIVGLTSGNTSSQCFIYDSLADSWSDAMAPLPVGINHAGSASDGVRYIYFMNGRAGKNVPSTGFDTNQRYDTLTDSWTLLAPAPVKRAGMGESVHSDGFIFVIGGESSWRPASATLGLAAGATFYRCDVYSVAGDVWNRYPNGSALPAVALQADGGGCTDLPLGIHGIYPALWTDSTKGTRQIVVAGGSFISGSENNASTFVFAMHIGSAALNVAPSAGRAINSWGPAVLRMSSGGAWVDSAGDAWKSDVPFLASPMTTGTLFAPALPDAPLQQQGRWASPVVDTLEYNLPIPCLEQDVMIRLHFVEHEFRAAGSRLFSVLIDDRIMLSRFDIFAEASLLGLANALVVRELIVPRATGPNLRLALMRNDASIGNPLINAIEVFCAAPLLPSPPLQQLQSKAAKASQTGPFVWLGIAAGYLALAIGFGGYR